MKKMVLTLTAIGAFSVLSGCATVVPTTSYTPQNIVRYEHRNSVAIGKFTYEAEFRNEVETNQIQLNGAGSLYISTSVGEMVKRATGLELEKSGVFINDFSDISIDGDIVELRLNAYGFNTMAWDYTIRYKIFQIKNQKSLLSKEYKIPTKRTGKMNHPRDYAPLIHELVLTGYDMFIRDPEVRALLDVPVITTPP